MGGPFSLFLFRRVLALLAYAIAYWSMFMPKELALPCLPAWIAFIFAVDAGDCFTFLYEYYKPW